MWISQRSQHKYNIYINKLDILLVVFDLYLYLSSFFFIFHLIFDIRNIMEPTLFGIVQCRIISEGNKYKFWSLPYSKLCNIRSFLREINIIFFHIQTYSSLLIRDEHPYLSWSDKGCIWVLLHRSGSGV